MDHMDLQLDHLARIVGVATAPAFLLGAVAMQVRVLNNRLSRIVDRERWLRQQPPPEEPARANEVAHEARVLQQRKRTIYRAILLCCLCALLVCCVIAALFIDDLLGADIDPLLAALFVSAMACMVGSYLFFLDEIFLSIRKLRLTIRGSRKLPPQT
ncbi:MAG: hypothetical protein JWP36_1985 [Paucimonas sp.]|nr:hypothetical protein [Paucimonas sp.]